MNWGIDVMALTELSETLVSDYRSLAKRRTTWQQRCIRVLIREHPSEGINSERSVVGNSSVAQEATTAGTPAVVFRVLDTCATL
jgi:hypothetical protein